MDKHRAIGHALVGSGGWIKAEQAFCATAGIDALALQREIDRLVLVHRKLDGLLVAWANSSATG